MKSAISHLSLALVVSLSFGLVNGVFAADSADNFPNADEMRAKRKAAEEKQKAEDDQKKHETSKNQIAKLKSLLNSATKGPIFWNRNNDQEPLTFESLTFLEGRGYHVDQITVHYFADECGCDVRWQTCTHPDPTDKQSFIYYQISW